MYIYSHSFPSTRNEDGHCPANMAQIRQSRPTFQGVPFPCRKVRGVPCRGVRGFWGRGGKGLRLEADRRSGAQQTVNLRISQVEVRPKVEEFKPRAQHVNLTIVRYGSGPAKAWRTARL